jgi:hypothetical protein
VRSTRVDLPDPETPLTAVERAERDLQVHLGQVEAARAAAGAAPAPLPAAPLRRRGHEQLAAQHAAGG